MLVIINIPGVLLLACYMVINSNYQWSLKNSYYWTNHDSSRTCWYLKKRETITTSNKFPQAVAQSLLHNMFIFCDRKCGQLVLQCQQTLFVIRHSTEGICGGPIFLSKLTVAYCCCYSTEAVGHISRHLPVRNRRFSSISTLHRALSQGETSWLWGLFWHILKWTMLCLCHWLCVIRIDKGVFPGHDFCDNLLWHQRLQTCSAAEMFEETATFLFWILHLEVLQGNQIQCSSLLTFDISKFLLW